MRVVGLLLLPHSRAFDVAVVGEVWGVDRTDSGVGPFELRVCSPARAAQPTSPLGSVAATHGLAGLRGCDLVIVPGRADPHAPVPEAAVRALRALEVPVVGLCAGAFTLAAAGMLDDLPATTHWRLLDELAIAAPRAQIRCDVLFTTGSRVLTSAGVVGAIDLCLHLIRRDHGADVAAALARRMVMAPARTGDQRQYVDPPVPARPSRPGIAATIDWANARLTEPVGVADMARHAEMGERTFHRTFAAATGVPPGRWLNTQRVLLARRLLEGTDLPVQRVAERSGLGTAANLRRRLRASVGVGPDEYRRTFTQPQAKHPRR